MTEVEKKLWSDLRGAQIGVSFRKQHPAGRYVLDFYAPSLKLAVELDGDQHGWEKQARSDAIRDAWLRKRGVTVLRFSNVEFLRNRVAVLETIFNVVGELKRSGTPTLTLPLSGGGSLGDRPVSEDIAQKQLDAYNKQDLDAYCACFTDDIVVADLNGKVTTNGNAALKARYADVFKKFPGNHARLVSRMRVGNTIVDHEDVSRGPGLERFEIIVIYTLRDGKIARADFAR